MTNAVNKWIRAKIRDIRKGKCQVCQEESTELQFAHLTETTICGRGRGRKERYYDFIRNREKYALVCSPDCNTIAEALGREGLKSAKDGLMVLARIEAQRIMSERATEDDLPKIAQGRNILKKKYPSCLECGYLICGEFGIMNCSCGKRTPSSIKFHVLKTDIATGLKMSDESGQQRKG